MKYRIIKVGLVLLPFVMGLAFCRPYKGKTIPVSTRSEIARTMYLEAGKYFEKVYISRAVELLERALAEDPDFFMAAYGLATHHMFEEEKEEFLRYAEQALQSDLSLSAGEILLKAALQKLLEDQKADVTEFGMELVRRYPDDPDAYFHLSFFQEIAGNHAAQIETLLQAAEIKEDPANVYNSLGYVYMDAGQWNNAQKAFDRYIELKPEEPNPYDSKGDYYMAIKEYGRAYESYMKAFEIDPSWTGSLQKAKKAGLADSLNIE